MVIASATDFFQATTYPDNLAQAKLINSTWFPEDIIGRADVTNVFKGRELNTEYVFGLFASVMSDKTMFNNLGAPTDSVVQSLLVSGNYVSVSALFTITYPSWGLNGNVKMIADFTIEFTECGQVRQYDLRFPRFEWAQLQVRQLMRLRAGRILNKSPKALSDVEIDAVQDKSLVDSICSVHERYCHGPNAQYKSTAECRSFVASLPTGRSWEYGGNTKSCRAMHQNMIPSRPSVHCPHIGKSGGGMCVQRDYLETVSTVPFNPPMWNV